jgi:hypothetical protein
MVLFVALLLVPAAREICWVSERGYTLSDILSCGHERSKSDGSGSMVAQPSLAKVDLFILYSIAAPRIDGPSSLLASVVINDGWFSEDRGVMGSSV